jgi:D-amino peptidase
MVFRFDQTRLPDASPERNHEAKRLLTLEVNACVDGILDFDPEAEVVVSDGHGSGGIVFELFHDRAQLVAGRDRPAGGARDASFDAQFFVGQHAMAGTPNAPLAHTMFSRTIEHYRLNGQLVGEFGYHALLAGTVYGTPSAFLSGDDRAVAEAHALVPNLVGVVTKWGMGWEAARSLSPARSRALTRAGAAEACRRVQGGHIRPPRLEPPYTLEVRFLPGQESGVERLLQRGFERLDERTALLTSDDPMDIWRQRQGRMMRDP